MRIPVGLIVVGLVNLLLAGGFLTGLWPYGVELGGIAGFAFLAGWYLGVNKYILLTSLLAVMSDGLSASVDFTHTKTALVIMILTLGLRYQGFVLSRLQLTIIVGIGLLINATWSYIRSDLSIGYGGLAVFSGLIGLCFWAFVIKLLPSPGDRKLFSS